MGHACRVEEGRLPRQNTAQWHPEAGKQVKCHGPDLNLGDHDETVLLIFGE